MSTVQDTDILLVDRAGKSYQTPVGTASVKLVSTDLLLVQRGTQSYQVAVSNISSVQDTDYLLINRGSDSYKVLWSDVKEKVVSFTPSGSYVVDTFAAGGSLNLNTTSKSFLSTGPASNMWDGIQNVGAIANGAPGTIVWRPNPTSRPAFGVTKIEIQWPGSGYCSTPQGQLMGPVYLNGQAVNWSQSCSFITIYNDPNNPITIESLGFTGASGSNARITGIKVNDNYLIEGQT